MMTQLFKIIGFLSLIIFASSFSTSTLGNFSDKGTHLNNMVQDSVLVDTIAAVDSTMVFTPFKNNVHASYYHDKFNGRRTASGQLFDNDLYTAAHRTLKFGTKVRVTNTVNGASVIVTVNDRGPFVKGREIDLSKKAFMEIAKFKLKGYLIVQLDILEE